MTNHFWRSSQDLVDNTLNCKFKDFSIVKTFLPTTTEEQTAIAQVLQAADKEINLLKALTDLLDKSNFAYYAVRTDTAALQQFNYPLLAHCKNSDGEQGIKIVIDKWDKGMNLPIHGSIEYDQTTSRTGGYRFYLSDKLNFDKSITLTMEHQPDEKRNVKTDYTSVGFFYAEDPHFVNTKILMEEKITKTPRREKLTPQGMLLTLYWLATASFDDPAIVFSMKKSDAWYADVDMEAIPIVQLSLPKLDQGRYRLYVQHGNTKNGSPFSVWQRSKQVSDWIPTDIETSPIEGKIVVAGNIDITDDLKTITLRKKKIDEASIRIYSFYFEKIDILN